jgi:hypothetical protein
MAAPPGDKVTVAYCLDSKVRQPGADQLFLHFIRAVCSEQGIEKILLQYW